MMRRLGYVSTDNADTANASARDLIIGERDAIAAERDALASKLSKMQKKCNDAVRERDSARIDKRCADEHTAAVTRAMGKVRTAMAQVFESVKEMEHWLAKHGEEISADLDSDLVLGGGYNLGDHESLPSELEGPQIAIVDGKFKYIGPEY
jgi:hypothetical protein